MNLPKVILVAANSLSERTIETIRARKSAHALPPLGTLYVATYLLNYGWDAEVLDAERDLLSEEETVQAISDRAPVGAFVGWTTWITTMNRIGRMGARLRESRPDLRQFIGGPHMSAVPLKTLERYGDIFPYGVVGEGELVVDKLLRLWGDDDALSAIPGIVCYAGGSLRFKSDTKRGYSRAPSAALHALETGQEIEDAPREEEPAGDARWPLHADRIEDLERLEIPRYELLGDLSAYHLSEFTPPVGERQMSMITSRGCPYSCSFCDQEVSGHNWRGFSPEKTLEHMLYLRRLGIDYFYLTDDLYLVRLDDVERTARLILATPGMEGVRWEAITRINLVLLAAATRVSLDGEPMNLLQLIARAGCVQLHVAPETGNQRLRFETVFKNITNAQIVDAMERMREAGISPKILNMVGLPGETPEITLETLRFIRTLGEHGARYAMISVFTPLPMTPAAQLIEQQVLKWTGDLDDWEMMNLGTPAGTFTTDMRGRPVDATPPHILMAARGKHRLGDLAGEADRREGTTIEQKIALVQGLVDAYREAHPAPPPPG